MPKTLHRSIRPENGVHVVHAWETTVAGLGALSVSANDVGKIARTSDTLQFHILVSADPPLWMVVGSISGATEPDAVSVNGGRIGDSFALAREDHSHDVTTAAPTALSLGAATSEEGTSDALARADHVHATSALTAALPAAGDDLPSVVRVPVETENGWIHGSDPGASADYARADHVHEASTAPPSSIGLTNSEGSSEHLARADHVHDGSALYARALRYVNGADTPTTADRTRVVVQTSGVPVNMTLAAGNFSPGDVLVILPAGAGQITFVSAQTMRIPPGYVNKSRGQWAEPVIALCLSAAEWHLSGGLAVF